MKYLILWDEVSGNDNRIEFFKQVVSKLITKNLFDESEDLVIRTENRERLSSTIIASNLALPHIVVDGQCESCLVYIKSEQAVLFGKCGEMISRFIFIVTPNDIPNADKHDLKNFFTKLGNEENINLMSNGNCQVIEDFFELTYGGETNDR